MHPYLQQLQPYPFERLRQLVSDIQPNDQLSPISFNIGEPRHPTPELIKQALIAHLNTLSQYPTTHGTLALRQAIAHWLMQRYHLPQVNPETEVLPVNGSRETLFAFTQAIIDSRIPAKVVCPNPFYQIYEGAALLAGAQPLFAPCTAGHDFAMNLTQISVQDWQQVQLLFVCSPGNPTGKILDLQAWRELFALSDRYGFVIASDECYSEIYFDENHPPLGALQAAHQLGRSFERLISFSSLSKRSNAPGMRSGFVAGDADLIKAFLQYRTYHGCAMSPAVQAASIAAWQDEVHVQDNRQRYRAKFNRVMPMLASTPLQMKMPDAGFYLWINVSHTGLNDTEFARALLAQYNLSVLPGSYLARTVHGTNPGENYIRMALVAEFEACLEGVQRLVAFCAQRG
jgi:N-succinyldiaminopimelate aminotransferase